jgi:mannose-1-phosphate guanylyltransferase/mannose-6-phosphate isomerase
MLQETVSRTSGSAYARPLVVAGESYRFQVKDQLEETGCSPAAILLEPEGRNTAAAVALAAFWLIAHECNELMLVMPSDHVIADNAAFEAALAAAAPAAQAGALVTFGVAAQSPKTEYGYIQRGALTEAAGVYQVGHFVEKPDLASARRYVEAGNYFWNSGIFLLHASTYLAELETFAPEIARACSDAMRDGSVDGCFVRPEPIAFRTSPNKSIDHAVMELTDKACVVPVEMGWSDVGSWDALWAISHRDEQDNAIRGDVIAIQTSSSIIRSDPNITVAAVGVQDMVIIATRDAVLIVPRDQAHKTKEVVDELGRLGRTSHEHPSKVQRPWGSYEVTDRGERFQTKRIIVKPHGQLSLQVHRHRSEHWVVVSGTARVTIGGEVRALHENESAYIPAGVVHRLENPGNVPLHLIEVQCGGYLGEDDIVRLEDSYSRHLPD